MGPIELQLSGLDGVYDMLKSLPAEIVSKRGGPVKQALRKGALVIQKQELLNLQAVISQAKTTDEAQRTGLLAKNVVVTRGKPPNDGKGERYLVRIKRKSYVRKAGRLVTTLKSAQLLEYGSKEQPPRPWIRPAFLAKAEEAIRTVESSLVPLIDKAVARALKAKVK